MNRQQNRKNEKQNKLLSAFYDYIGEYHIDNICADMESRKDAIDSTEVPQSLDAWFEQYVRGIRRKEFRRRFAGKVKIFSSRAAVVLVVLLFSFVTLSLSVDAIRTQIFNMLSTDFQKYSSVRIEDGQTSNVKIEWEYYYFPTYVPEGFYIETVKGTGSVKTIWFVNGSNEHIVFAQAPNGVDFNLDIEDGTKKEVVIKDRKAVFVEKDKKNFLIWNNEEYSFSLISTMDEEILQFIAESLEKK